MRARGFTLVEILLVMGITAILLALTVINLARPQLKATVDSTVLTLVADIKNQQLRAMSGDSVSASSAQAHGVRVQSGTYTLFKGASYSAGDTDNYTVAVDTGISLSTTFASSQVVFTKGTGDVTSFVNGQNTITVTNGALSKVITINRYGAVTVN